MPEALAIVAVAAVAVVIYVGMWMQSRDPALYDAQREHARLQQQVKWLEERLAVARSEKWDHAMVSVLANDLNAATEQLEQMRLRKAA